MKRKLKPEARAFIEFFRTQGIKFIDNETGEELEIEEE